MIFLSSSVRAPIFSVISRAEPSALITYAGTSYFPAPMISLTPGI